ncbi:hypothetical protein SeLEV6574_g02612 [Synchytrium endobioticum]|uniref:Uncharacterized protein n=1 Tax=Synchytrium endobioticum TaxID=286115 RepID=A0A507D7W1_9FUNG|nr:hypothetical protein SeLEV6574_g02612 [Synchytrium endobioticum]
MTNRLFTTNADAIRTTPRPPSAPFSYETAFTLPPAVIQLHVSDLHESLLLFEIAHLGSRLDKLVAEIQHNAGGLATINMALARLALPTPCMDTAVSCLHLSHYADHAHANIAFLSSEFKTVAASLLSKARDIWDTSRLHARIGQEFEREWRHKGVLQLGHAARERAVLFQLESILSARIHTLLSQPSKKEYQNMESWTDIVARTRLLVDAKFPPDVDNHDSGRASADEPPVPIPTKQPAAVIRDGDDDRETTSELLAHESMLECEESSKEQSSQHRVIKSTRNPPSHGPDCDKAPGHTPHAEVLDGSVAEMSYPSTIAKGSN